MDLFKKIYWTLGKNPGSHSTLNWSFPSPRPRSQPFVFSISAKIDNYENQQLWCWKVLAWFRVEHKNTYGWGMVGKSSSISGNQIGKDGIAGSLKLQSWLGQIAARKTIQKFNREMQETKQKTESQQDAVYQYTLCVRCGLQSCMIKQCCTEEVREGYGYPHARGWTWGHARNVQEIWEGLERSKNQNRCKLPDFFIAVPSCPIRQRRIEVLLA